MEKDPRFPIGKFDLAAITAERSREMRISTIADLPNALREAVKDLDESKLNEPYRADGWSVRQVVHHIADSHINSFCRFKLALTEDRPTIRGYFEERWAELPDSKGSIAPSISIIDGVHGRWSTLLRAMTDAEFEKELNHPESGLWKLDGMLSLYDWHSRHHTAHITSLCERMNW